MPGNWAGNISFSAAGFHEPDNIDELQEIVRRSERVGVVGAGHSFNPIADTAGEMVSLARLATTVKFDKQNATATIPAGMTYGDLCPVLDRAGYALPNMASLNHITLAGACATATHGSGPGQGNLAAPVIAIERIMADGELVSLSREQEGFDGSVVNLGALGITTNMTLELAPRYHMQQAIYRGMTFDTLYQAFDEILEAAYSVCLFTNWQSERLDTAWLKFKQTTDEPLNPPPEFYGESLVPFQGDDPQRDRVTTVLGKAAPWYQVLPHFVLKSPKVEGQELQSEYFVAKDRAADAIRAVTALREQLAPIIGVTEIRLIAADRHWLSTAYGSDAVGIHFNWIKDWPAVKAFLPTLEACLAPFDARPHWGKLFTLSARQLEPLYDRFDDFRELVNRLDPTGKFSNPYLTSLLQRTEGSD